MNLKKRYLLFLGLLIMFNMVLAACGDPTPLAGTPVAAGTGQIVPGLGLGTPSATTQAAATTTTASTTQAATTAAPGTTAAATTAAPATTAATTASTTSAATTQAATTPPATTTDRYIPTFAAYKEPAVTIKPAVKAYTVAAN